MGAGESVDTFVARGGLPLTTRPYPLPDDVVDALAHRDPSKLSTLLSELGDMCQVNEPRLGKPEELLGLVKLVGEMLVQDHGPFVLGEQIPSRGHNLAVGISLL